ncbi:MAG: CHASE domain-containing protein [Massilia sp.]
MPRWLHRSTALRSTAAALGTGAVLSLSMGLVCYTVTANIIDKNASDRFDGLARTVQYTINGSVKSFTDVLRGTASLFQSTGTLTHDQFRVYVKGLSLEENFPGLETINFAMNFKQGERRAVERKMDELLGHTAKGYPVFAIEPPGDRAEYTTLTYIEPIQSWSNKFGMDLHARTPVAIALGEARDTGKVQTSGYPVQLRPGMMGLGMRLPVYRSGMPTDTVAERRAAYVGSVGIGFSVERMVQRIVDGMRLKGIRLTLSAIGPVPAPPGAPVVLKRAVLFDSLGLKAPPPRLDSKMQHIALPISFNGRTWNADFSIRKVDLYTGFDLYVPWLAMLAGCLSTMLLYALFHTLSSSRQRAVLLAQEMTKELRASESRLQQSNETLRRLGAHAEDIKEGERKRIAREIHDDLGQNLLALRIDAQMLTSRTSGRQNRLHQRALETLLQIDQTIRSVRQIINDLRPNVLDLGLNAAVEWLIAEFRRRTNIQCQLIENDTDIRVSDQCATALFRILQESLANIVRHARATQVRVELRVEPRWISMTVNDNGVGFQPSGHQKPGSFGLVGVEERINIMRGTFAIASRPGIGTTVHVSIPLQDEAGRPTPGSGVMSVVARDTEVV